MNKKGFTLVELLVVMAVLGVITGLSIPVIRNIQEKQKSKKFDVYMTNLVTSGKLYIDSYSKDLFGAASQACGYITYQDLVEHNLIKDIDMADVSCNSEDTVVRVNKYDDRYFYKGYLGCGPEKNGSTEAVSFFPEKVKREELCTNSTYSVTFTDNQKAPNAISYKTRNIKVIASTIAGISTAATENPTIYYTFVKKGEEKNLSSASWAKLNFPNIPTKDEQMEIISKGETISITSNKVDHPIPLTGDYSLVIRVDKFLNLNNTSWNANGNQDEKYFTVGTYTFDNSPPSFGTNSKIVSSVTNYNHLKPKLALNIDDNLTSQNSDFKYCYSYGTESDHRSKCPIPKDKKDTAALNKYSDYKNGDVLKEITDKYDGSSHTVYITILDAALNAATAHFDYKVSKEFKLTYDNRGGSGCSNNITKIENEAWGDLCKPTKTGHAFTGWNTKADGSGSTVTSATKATNPPGNLTAYAQWGANTHTITYNGNGATGGSTATTSCKYGADCSLRASGFTKTGHTFDGWYTAASGGNKYGSTTQLKENITVYAHWKPNTYTISYEGGGATSGSTAATTCTYGQAVNAATNGFVRTGYTFTGWSGIPDTCNANATATANWRINIVKIRYKVNSGESLINTGQGFTTSGGYVYRNGTNVIHSVNYGASLSKDGLADYHNSNWIKIEKAHYTGVSGQEWVSGSTKFNQQTVYTASQLCDTIDKGDCTLDLSVNWRANTATIRYHTGTSSGSSLSHKPAGWLIKNNYEIWTPTTQDIQVVIYPNTVNLLNYHNSNYLYIKKSSSSNGSAPSGAEWEKCNNANCANATYSQSANYSTDQICNTTNGDCTCCIKVNWS